MKHMYRLLTVLLIVFCCTSQTKASHIAGGDITWECLGDGSYRFRLVVYRDCAGLVQLDPPVLNVSNHPTVNTIGLHQVDNYDISHLCNFGTPVNCSSATNGTVGALEKYVFESNPIFLGSNPPAAGWIFTYDACCRNYAIINIVDAGNYGVTFRAKMYGNSHGNPCLDSSPQFAENPFFMGCANTPMIGYNYAVDPDGDSLSYSWAPALHDFYGNYVEGVNPAVLAMDTGYTYYSPFPDASFNPNNVPVELDPVTGIMTFTSSTLGTFVYVIKVSSWRNGELVSEVYREIQAIIVSCNEIGPAVAVQPPFYHTGSQSWVYEDTVTAGDLVNVNIVADALGNLSSGNAPVVMLQASGNQFGTGYTNSASGCAYPPCATLSPPPPAPDTSAAHSILNWQTSVSHLITGPGSTQTYDFIFTGNNGVCPLPQYDTKVIRITLNPPPQFVSLSPPTLNCVQVQSVSGDSGMVQLNWTTLQDPNSIFNNYTIYHSTAYDGPYTVLDSVSDINQASYTYTDNINQPNYYYITTNFTHNSGQLESYQSGVLRLGMLWMSSDFGVLGWNIGSRNITNCNFEIWRQLPGEPWQIIDYTEETFYVDTFINGYIECEDLVKYKVVCANGSCSQETNVVQQYYYETVPSSSINWEYVNNIQTGLVQFTTAPYHPVSSYLWDFGDGATSDKRLPVHQYTANGQYIVQMIRYTPCDTDTFTKLVNIAVDGINETDNNFSYEIYPNPTKDNLVVKIALDAPGSAEVRLLDILGRVEKTMPAMQAQTNMGFAFDVTDLPAGIHLVEMRVNGRRTVGKFVKE